MQQKFSYFDEYGAQDRGAPLQESLVQRYGIMAKMEPSSVPRGGTTTSTAVAVTNNSSAEAADMLNVNPLSAMNYNPIDALLNPQSPYYNNGRGAPPPATAAVGSEGSARHLARLVTTPAHPDFDRSETEGADISTLHQQINRTSAPAFRGGDDSNSTSTPLARRYPPSLAEYHSPTTIRMLGIENPAASAPINLLAKHLRQSGSNAAVNPAAVSSPSTHWHGIPINHKMAPYAGQPLHEQRRAAGHQSLAVQQLVAHYSEKQLAFEENSRGAVGDHHHRHDGADAIDGEVAHGGHGPAAALQAAQHTFTGANGSNHQPAGIMGSNGSTIVLNTDPNAPLFKVVSQNGNSNGINTAAPSNAEKTSLSTNHTNHGGYYVGSAPSAPISINATPIPHRRPHDEDEGYGYDPAHRDAKAIANEVMAAIRGASAAVEFDIPPMNDAASHHHLASSPSNANNHTLGPARPLDIIHRNSFSPARCDSSPPAAPLSSSVPRQQRAAASSAGRPTPPPHHHLPQQQQQQPFVDPYVPQRGPKSRESINRSAVAAHNNSNNTTAAAAASDHFLAPLSSPPFMRGTGHAIATPHSGVDVVDNTSRRHNGQSALRGINEERRGDADYNEDHPHPSRHSSVAISSGSAHHHHQQQQQQQQQHKAVNTSYSQLATPQPPPDDFVTSGDHTQQSILGMAGTGLKQSPLSPSRQQQTPRVGPSGDVLSAHQPDSSSGGAAAHAHARAHPYAAPTLVTGPYGFRATADGRGYTIADDHSGAFAPISMADHSRGGAANAYDGGDDSTITASPLIDQSRLQQHIASYNATIKAAIDAAAEAAKVSTRVRGKREEEEGGDGERAVGLHIFDEMAPSDVAGRYQRLLAGEVGAARELQPREQQQWPFSSATTATAGLNDSSARDYTYFMPGNGNPIGLTDDSVAAPFAIVDMPLGERDLPAGALVHAAYNSALSPASHRVNIGDLCALPDLKSAVFAVAREVLSAEMKSLARLREEGRTSAIPATSPLALLVGGAGSPSVTPSITSRQMALRAGSRGGDDECFLQNADVSPIPRTATEGARGGSVANSRFIDRAHEYNGGAHDTAVGTPDGRHAFLHRQIGPTPLDRPSQTPLSPHQQQSRTTTALRGFGAGSANSQYDPATRRIIEQGGNGNGAASTTAVGPSAFYNDLDRYLGDTHEGVAAGASFTSDACIKIIANVAERFLAKHTVMTTHLPLPTHLQGEIGAMVRQEMLRASISYGRHVEEPLLFGSGPYRLQELSGPVVDAKRVAADRLATLKVLDQPPAKANAVWIPGESYKKQPPTALSADGTPMQHSPFEFTAPITVAGDGREEDLRAAPNVPYQHPAAIAVAADLALSNVTVVIGEPTFTYGDGSSVPASTGRKEGPSEATVVIVASVDREMDIAVCPPVWTLSIGNQHTVSTPLTTALSIDSLVAIRRASVSQVLRTSTQSVFVLELMPGAVQRGQQYTVWFKPTPSSTLKESRTFWVP